VLHQPSTRHINSTTAKSPTHQMRLRSVSQHGGSRFRVWRRETTPPLLLGERERKDLTLLGRPVRNSLQGCPDRGSSLLRLYAPFLVNVTNEPILSCIHYRSIHHLPTSRVLASTEPSNGPRDVEIFVSLTASFKLSVAYHVPYRVSS
jgi:hypothetical protein